MKRYPQKTHVNRHNDASMKSKQRRAKKERKNSSCMITVNINNMRMHVCNVSIKINNARFKRQRHFLTSNKSKLSTHRKIATEAAMFSTEGNC